MSSLSHSLPRPRPQLHTAAVRLRVRVCLVRCHLQQQVKAGYGHGGRGGEERGRSFHAGQRRWEEGCPGAGRGREGGHVGAADPPSSFRHLRGSVARATLRRSVRTPAVLGGAGVGGSALHVGAAAAPLRAARRPGTALTRTLPRAATRPSRAGAGFVRALLLFAGAVALFGRGLTLSGLRAWAWTLFLLVVGLSPQTLSISGLEPLFVTGAVIALSC